MIVAESTGRRLTAYSIGADGELSDRRVFADGLDGPPDGICLDAEGGVWTSMTLAHQFERIEADGGEGHVTHRIDIGDRAAIACMLGGAAGARCSCCRAPMPIPSAWWAPGSRGSTR